MGASSSTYSITLWQKECCSWHQVPLFTKCIRAHHEVAHHGHDDDHHDDHHDDHFDAQSMENMGGLASRLPITATAMFVGSMSIIGIPFIGGFGPKKELLQVLGR